MEQTPDLRTRVSLRAVRPEDDDFLLEVYGSTRADEMALVPWTEEQKKAFLRMQLDAQRRDYEAHFPAADYHLIMLDDKSVGRIWVARLPDEIHLLDIALLPAYQGRGIGTLLLRQLIDEAEGGGKKLSHTVFKLNEGARRFYERLGFELVSEMGMYLVMERQSRSGASHASGD